MINTCTGKLSYQLTIPYTLVHKDKPDARTWLPLLLVRYFNHPKTATYTYFTHSPRLWQALQPDVLSTLIPRNYTPPQKEALTQHVIIN